MQSTSHILMIRPAAFGFNEQTAGSNAFQQIGSDHQAVQEAAIKEFEVMVQMLQQNGVDVTVLKDTEEPTKPDAVFPNNWLSFHETGDVILYPMQAHNRRLERREDIVRKLEDRFQVNHIIDLSRFEIQEKFLEGTGSMVLDRDNRIAYACLSSRTNIDVLNEFCNYAGYKPVAFNAVDHQQQPIYHTNVLMSVGDEFAVICLECITNENEKRKVINSLTETGKEVVEISTEQLQHFAGNMLQIRSTDNKSLLVMSQQAYDSFTDSQKEILNKYGQLLYVNLNTIETNGGGSARCMMAEVYLPIK